MHICMYVCICIGPDQGICGCNQTCLCLPGWFGVACDCSLSDASCISPLGVSFDNILIFVYSILFTNGAS